MGNIEQRGKGTEVNWAWPDEDIGGVRSGSSLVSIGLPNYVQRQEGVPRAGALSAEAVVRDYETAAKEIESMGAELIEAAKNCEAMTADVHDAIAFMRDTAAAYRDEGKKIFNRIQECALFTDDVRKSCGEVKRKILEGNDTN